MLELPNVTLISMDTQRATIRRTIKAMQYSMLQVRFARTVLLTDKDVCSPDMLRTIGGQGRLGIEVVHVKQGGREDYERALICNLENYFDTSHCLFQEWDSAVLNPNAWDNDWLEYGWIGAPWPYGFNERGYPPCTENNCVGNGGLSLRSLKMCESCTILFRRFSSSILGWQKSDAWICRSMADRLKSCGIRFAPHDTAARFACENRFYSGQFGAHGKNTIKMNGWDWSFDWLV